MIKFEFYKNKNGEIPFEDFLDSLPDKDANKFLWLIETVEQQGLSVASRQGWTKKLEDNLFELRSKEGTNIQRGLYFHLENGKYIITHGFTKKTNKTPEIEKNRARVIRVDFFKNQKDSKKGERQ